MGCHGTSRFVLRVGIQKLAYYEELLSGGEPDIQSSSYPGLFDLPLAIVHNQFSDWGTRSQKGATSGVCVLGWWGYYQFGD